MTKIKYSKSIFKWHHFLIYLSGPIDYAYDRGINWREEWTKKLINIGFDSKNILNPCQKPLPEDFPFDLNDESRIISKFRKQKKWDELCSFMSQIVHIDLRLVDKADIVVVYFPNIFDDKELKLLEISDELYLKMKNIKVNTYGTIHEIVVARQQRKPVYVVCEGGKENCSGWIMWLVGHRNIFDSVHHLMSHLKDISGGKVYYNAKDWLLIDYEKNKKSIKEKNSCKKRSKLV